MNLHPDVLAYLAEVAPEFPPPGTALSAAESRALHRRVAARHGAVRSLAVVQDFTAPGPAGTIACRLYAGREGGERPALVYLHGGGWIGGDLETHDALCRELAFSSGCAVIAVDYRLAPEHKFPAPFHDCLAACAHAFDQAGSLGLDPNRIAIGGDSAGGNLAAAVVQAMRGRSGARPAFQCLLYPALDLRLATPSFQEMRPPAFSAAEAAWCVDHYLDFPSQVLDVRASPALAPDLAGLPPAYIATAEYDGLRDDGERYALALAGAGVPVQVRRYQRVTHGFMSMPARFRVAGDAIDDLGRALRAALA